MSPKDVQDGAETARSDVPFFDGAYVGPATVETYSVVYDRDGAPAFGSVIGRTPAGDRVFGRIDVADTAALDPLLSMQRSPVGDAGAVTVGEDGLQRWAAA